MASATSVSELAKVLGTTRAPLLIDVRRDPTFQAAEHLIAGAIRRSPEDVGQWYRELSKDRPIITVCRAGGRSAQATVILQKDAFKDVANLTGGMLRWRAEGHAVESGSG